MSENLVGAFKRKCEKLWPLALGGVCTAAFWGAQAHNWIVPDLTVALSAITTVAAIAIGFLSTAKSILISIKDTKPILVALQSSDDMYDRLMDYMRAAIYWCFISAILSSLAMFISSQTSIATYRILTHLVVFTYVTAGGACFRIIRYFFMLLNSKG